MKGERENVERIVVSDMYIYEPCSGSFLDTLEQQRCTMNQHY